MPAVLYATSHHFSNPLAKEWRAAGIPALNSKCLLYRTNILGRQFCQQSRRHGCGSKHLLPEVKVRALDSRHQDSTQRGRNDRRSTVSHWRTPTTRLLLTETSSRNDKAFTMLPLDNKVRAIERVNPYKDRGAGRRLPPLKLGSD